jgi:malyl-CoA/(S)-citramalyl-CoA lyase
MTPRVTRTYLAVPAHRARLVQSAAASLADAVLLDLEDAVPPPEKATALGDAAAALANLDWGRKTVAVRLNAVGSDTQADEIRRLATLPRLDAFLVPKAETTAEVASVRTKIAQAAGTRPAPELELLIETARGLINVDSLAAEPGVTALHLGVGDLAASLGARTADIGLSPPTYKHLDTPLDLFAYPMMRLLVAARAFGLRAIDGPCGAYKDPALTRATAIKAAAMGFDGKQVIHPTQIEPTRDAFIPSAAEIDYAKRVATAMDNAGRDGLAAVTVDGKMIDLANLRMIRRILELAAPGPDRV